MIHSLAGALIISLLAYAIIQSIGSEYPSALNILALSVFCIAFLTLYAISLPNLSMLTLAICLYHLAFLIIPGMIHAARGQFPFYSLRYSERSATAAAFVVLIHSASFASGFAVASTTRGRPRNRFSDQISPNAISVARTLLLSLSGLVISAICILWLGPSAYANHNPYEEADASQEFGPKILILLNLPRMLMFLVGCMAIRTLSQKPNFVTLLNLCLVLPVIAFVDNPIVIARFYLFAFLIVLVILFVPQFSRLGKAAFAAAAFGAVATVFPYVDYLRRGDITRGFAYDPVGYYASSGDFDGFQSLINIVDVVDQKGPSFGFQLLGSLFTFVPRELWPSKPFATGQMAADSAGYDFTNISAPLPGELFVDFSWFGVSILSAGLGYLTYCLDVRGFEAKIHDRFGSLLGYGGLVGFSAIVFRGSLLGVLAQVYLYFLSVLMVRIIAGP